MEEFIDEIDAKGNFIAKRPITDLKKQMFMHRDALIIPKAEGDKIILSKRSATKRPYPGTFCCAVGGKINHGETEEQAAKREMKEEIGRSYPVRKVGSFVFDSPVYKAIFTVFTTTVPLSPSDFVLDASEIEYVKSFSKSEVKKMIEESPDSFAPTAVVAIKTTIDLL